MEYFNFNSKKAKPITARDLEEKREYFNFDSKKAKPITARDLEEKRKKTKEELQKEYYEKYGIIYTGTDLGSCINSLLN